MKILLLGGTGAMGAHLGEILSSRKQDVVITTRSNRKSGEFIKYKQGDAKNSEFLNTLLEEKWDVIVDFMVYNENEMKVRVEKLLNATSQYMFLSSSRVYDNSMEYIKEDSTRLLDTSKDEEYLATSEYALSKARQEDILKASSKQNWTIIRPYITYSEIRLQLGTLEKENWLYRALKGRTIVFSEDIKNHFTTVTYGLDVAKAMVTLMNKTEALGEAIHITCNNAHKWEDILEIYLEVLEKELGSRPKVIFQNLDEYFSWNPGKYQIIYDRLFDRRFDNTKINQITNTDDFVSVEEGIRKCLTTFLKNPEFETINWESEALKDKIIKEKTPLQEINGLKQKIKYILFRYFI